METKYLGEKYRKWQMFVHIDHMEEKAQIEVNREGNISNFIKLRNLYRTLVDPIQGFRKKFSDYRINNFPITKNQEYEEFE